MAAQKIIKIPRANGLKLEIYEQSIKLSDCAKVLWFEKSISELPDTIPTDLCDLIAAAYRAGAYDERSRIKKAYRTFRNALYP